MPPARVLFYAATAGGLALSAFAVVYQPPPTWVAITALLGYLALITLGVTFSRYSMFADVVTAGPADATGAALTFDDGPDPETTPRVLELLEGAGVKATFFVIGKKAEADPELVRDILARGHALGVHSYAHERFMSLRSPRHVERDLGRSVAVIEEITGFRPRLFRAPIGHISPAMARAAKALELTVVGGWSGAQPEKVARKVTAGLEDGAIVLLHDASERGDFVPASIGALPLVIEAAERRRLPFVRVDRWLGEA